jgi:hypothetical protein
MARRRSTKSRKGGKKRSGRSSTKRSSARSRSKSRTRRSKKTSAKRSRSRSASRRSRARGMTRREFLKTAGVGAAALGAAAVGLGKVVRAQAPPPPTEVIYLADSGPFNDGKTKLFTVELVTGEPGQAILHQLPDLVDADTSVIYLHGEIPLDQADSLACTPDGTKLYSIDKKGGFQGEAHAKMGYVDLTTNTWYYLGYVKSGGVEVPGIGQAAFSPDGLLYVASDVTDKLYVLDTESGSPTTATDLGLITNRANDQTVNVSGADLIFASDGTLYLWANSAKPRGLYILEIPSSPGIVYADHVGPQPGEPGYDYPSFTGLAIRKNGVGDFVASITGYPFPTPPRPYASHMVEIYKSNGQATAASYRMYLNDNPHDYWYGDMTAGPLVECTRTIGYWKNHSWDGKVVTICGVEIGETNGKQILKAARGKNFSMLFAQLIAAKLNTYNAPYVPLIDEAEKWICSTEEPLLIEDGTIHNTEDFISKKQKAQAVAYWEALDEFNNSFPCEE